jgi:hypothetical protein
MAHVRAWSPYDQSVILCDILLKVLISLYRHYFSDNKAHDFLILVQKQRNGHSIKCHKQYLDYLTH